MCTLALVFRDSLLSPGVTSNVLRAERPSYQQVGVQLLRSLCMVTGSFCRFVTATARAHFDRAAICESAHFFRLPFAAKLSFFAVKMYGSLREKEREQNYSLRRHIFPSSNAARCATGGAAHVWRATLFHRVSPSRSAPSNRGQMAPLIWRHREE